MIRMTLTKSTREILANLKLKIMIIRCRSDWW